uniref:Uncharacterized protein n=1 Tax=Kalanchoe fedtschenkoi TaxID=63787 RepID=A0A7N0V699_KALFE
MTQMKNRNEAKIQKVSESGWTCAVEASRSAGGTVWPAFQAKLYEAPELTVEDRATMGARRVQQRAVEASRLFFSSNRDSDSEDDLGSEEEESESESLVEADVSDGCEEFIFFKKLFEEDEELRGYYQKNWGDGEFCCLVCRGNGEKVTKKFRSCVAVVQHSVTISRTQKTRAHRAYGQVICNLLSWDISKLPADALPVRDQGGSKLVLSNVGMTISQQDHGSNGAWDVRRPQDKRPTCTAEWGQFLSVPDIVVERELTEEEKKKVAAAKLQDRGREAARAFFSQNEFLDSDEEDDESEDDISTKNNESSGCEEYKFLVKLFEDDREMRDYYKRSWGNGAFLCLVCWGTVEKVNKKYKDCVGLVQHCVSVSRTKRKRAHRAYGKIICELLSWDINRLPASELPAGDIIRLKSGDSHVGETSLEIKSGEKDSEQCEESQKEFSERKSSEQPEEPKLDYCLEKGSEQCEESQKESSEKKSSEQPKTNYCGSEPCEESQEEIYENKSSEQPEEPKKDYCLEKCSAQSEEPKEDFSVEQQHNGSVNTVVSTNESGWAPFNPNTSKRLTRELTIAEQAKSNSIKVHQKSLDATRAFFSWSKGSDSDEDSQGEEDEEEEESKGNDLNNFFASLLEEGGDLMAYYQKNWEKGDFSCLVCGGTGENLTKKFKNLVAVVQHSVTIAKSKRIRAHRAYGQVICKALNWDIKRLPVVSSPTEENQGPKLLDCQQVFWLTLQGGARVNCENNDAVSQQASAN